MFHTTFISWYYYHFTKARNYHFQQLLERELYSFKDIKNKSYIHKNAE